VTVARHGVIVIDKPAGVSSARAIDPLKRLAGRQVKVGHAGTLDPFATGVLVALVGDATRLSDLAMRLPKTYVATVAFGKETDTLDPEGEVLAERDPGAAPADLNAVAARFVGEIEQVPPAYSALKIGGRRAYKLARGGTPVEPAARSVRVHAIDVLEVAWPEVWLRVVCGAGFYVRAFARDLGRALGLPAHLSALRRTHVGPFEDGDAPEDVAWDRLVASERIVEAAGLAWIDLSPGDARAFAAGGAVRVPDLRPGAAACGVRTESLFLGLGICEQPGRLQPKAVFASARARLSK
jgi:tRNA pseudouridine55 synthase